MSKTDLSRFSQQAKIKDLKDLFQRRGIPKIAVTMTKRHDVIVHINGRVRFRQKSFALIEDEVGTHEDIEWMWNNKIDAIKPSTEEVLFKAHLEREGHKV